MNTSCFIALILNAAYVHDLSPFAIKFTQEIGIRWYGLSYLAGFLCAYFIILHFSKKGRISVKPDQVSDFIFYAAVGAILGGRLGYCIFYDNSLFTKISNSFPFWGVLEVHKGGMASHGGILGVILACLLFAKREALSKIELLDLVALTACLGIMFGRFANFVNGELVGRPSSAEYAFAVKFPQDLLSISHEDITKWAELAPLANSLGYPDNVVQQALARKDGHFFDSVGQRAYEQIQKGNTLIKNQASQILTPRHPSQLYEAFLEGLLLFVVIFLAYKSYPKVGLASSLFMILYPIVRIIGEQFRLPDSQIGYQLFGLTRGQWISILMLLFGSTYSFFVLKKTK